MRNKAVSIMLLVGILSILVSAGASAEPVIEWEKTFGGAGTGTDCAFSVQQTTDGGYIAAGVTWSFATGEYDVYLIKTDSNGDLVWQKIFGGRDHDYAESVQQTSDGGYIVAGYTYSFGDEEKGDVYLIKTDSNGDLLWQKTFGGTDADRAYSVQQTTDGGYIVAGETWSFGAGSYLIKTDSNGNLMWQKTLGGMAYSVQQTSDGGYIVAGDAENDVSLIKTDSNGDLLWQKTFGGTRYEQALSVQQTSDEGYVVAGETESFGAGSFDAYLIKTDSNGNLMWQKTFGGTKYDRASSVQQTTDEGYILAGRTESFGAGVSDAYLIKTDSNGNLMWQKTLGGTKNDSAYSVQQTSDDGYIVAGWTSSFGSGNTDVYLVKIVPENQLPVASFTYSPENPEAGEEITFDASASYDPDGEIVFYEWDWNGDGDYDDFTASKITTFWWDEADTFKVALKVIDDKDNVSILYKQITIGESLASEVNAILVGFWPDWLKLWWWRDHRNFVKIDDWLTEFEPDSKPRSWLSAEFDWCEEADLIKILNKEIDSDEAPSLTYKIYALNVIEEEKLVNAAISQITPTYQFLLKPLFKYALGSVWSLPKGLAEEGILRLIDNIGVSIGMHTINLALKTVNLTDLDKELKQAIYVEALGVYFKHRLILLEPHDYAWGQASPLVEVSISLLAEEEKQEMREATEIYFEKLEGIYNGGIVPPFSGLSENFKKQSRDKLRELLLSALEKYKGELTNRKGAQIASPGELRVYDSEGRITGVIGGEMREEISNSAYDDETKRMVIFMPSDSYRYQVAGTNQGTYGLVVTSVEDGEITTFTATDIPTSPNAVHQYTADWEALSAGKAGATLKIDADGDGVFERTIISDNKLTACKVAIELLGYELISQDKVSETEFEYTFRVLAKNSAKQDVKDITFKLVGEPNNTSVIDGIVYFSIIKAGEQILSDDTFKVRSGKSPDVLVSDLVWQICKCIQQSKSDFNRDWNVGLLDLAELTDQWLQSCSDPNWCEETDLDQSGVVNFIDFGIFAKNWLWKIIPADLDIDGDVDFADYAVFASHWMDGNCAEKGWCDGADLDKSGSVDLFDLAELAEHWLVGR